MPGTHSLVLNFALSCKSKPLFSPTMSLYLRQNRLLSESTFATFSLSRGAQASFAHRYHRAPYSSRPTSRGTHRLAPAPFPRFARSSLLIRRDRRPFHSLSVHKLYSSFCSVRPFFLGTSNIVILYPSRRGSCSQMAVEEKFPFIVSRSFLPKSA